MNEEDKNKQQLENEIERLKTTINDELETSLKENSKNYSKLNKEVDDLQAEVNILKTGYNGDDDAQKEYRSQLREFNQFRFLRKKSNAQLTNRFAEVGI